MALNQIKRVVQDMDNSLKMKIISY